MDAATSSTPSTAPTDGATSVSRQHVALHVHAKEDGISADQRPTIIISPPPARGTRPQSTPKPICSTCCPPYGGNVEAFGWALDGIGRSASFIASAVFVGTALLTLAKQAAGCETEIPEGETSLPECTGKVYGIRPSSILTTYSTVVGIVSSALLPLVGSFIDHSRYRLQAGRYTALFVCVLLVPLIFVSEETWFGLAIILLILAFAGWIHTSIAFAYLPELTEEPDELVKFTASFTMIQYATTVLFLVFMIGLLSVLGLSEDEIAAARIAQSISAVVTSAVFLWAWTRCFGERPAFQAVPEDSTIWTAGFKKVYHSSVEICRHYRALKWFFVGIAFGEAAGQSLATIAITFLTDVLLFNSTENGIAILVMFIGTIPGALLSKYCTMRLNALWSAKISVTIMTVNTAMAAVFLTGPGQQIRTYIIGGIWGIGTGWKYTAERCIVCQVIPKGQDAELMGYYLFCGQILLWLPSLIFTILNENGVNMRIGIASVGAFFLIALVAYFVMGNYKDAMQVAEEGNEGNRSRSTGSSEAAVSLPEADNAKSNGATCEENG